MSTPSCFCCQSKNRDLIFDPGQSINNFLSPSSIIIIIRISVAATLVNMSVHVVSHVFYYDGSPCWLEEEDYGDMATSQGGLQVKVEDAAATVAAAAEMVGNGWPCCCPQRIIGLAQTPSSSFILFNLFKRI